MLRVLMICGLALAVHGSGFGMYSRTVTGAMSGGRQPRYENMNLGQNHLYPMNTVWQDLTQSKWKWVPAWLLGVQMLVPSSLITGDKQMFWECTDASQTGIPRCEVYAFAYACKACGHEMTEFLQTMNDYGFTKCACGPLAVVKNGGNEHKMLVFVKDLAAGSQLTIPFNTAPGKTEFVTFGMNGDPSPTCSSKTDQMACESMGGKCEWDTSVNPAGECVQKQCKSIPFGPGSSVPCTDKCIKDDL